MFRANRLRIPELKIKIYIRKACFYGKKEQPIKRYLLFAVGIKTF